MIFNFNKYGPLACLVIICSIIFVIWLIWGGEPQEFIGLNPLNPETCSNYTDSFYHSNNVPVTVTATEAPITVNNNNNNDKPAAPAPKVEKSSNRFLSRGEKICCETMQKIYGLEFKSVWPDWLVNPETNRKLELDCYNDSLKIAVEYNGEQHYKWPNFTNQSQEQFINQVRRDRFKRETCKKNGVYLITVPYKVPYDKIPDYIMQRIPEAINPR